MEAIIQKNVYIIIQNKRVFLVNKLQEPIEELVYCTYSMVTYDEAIGVSDRPYYRIENIPSGHLVYLETLDGWEDGSIHYELTAIKWATNSLNINQSLKQKKLSGLIKLPPKANCKIEKISKDNGFVVETNNKKTINQLYWQIEELKAYTDLVGNRFDIDNAQRRLWQMQTILKDKHLPQAQKLYDELNELLETPMFFDKNAFSLKVDKLFSHIEAKYKQFEN